MFLSIELRSIISRISIIIIHCGHFLPSHWLRSKTNSLKYFLLIVGQQHGMHFQTVSEICQHWIVLKPFRGRTTLIVRLDYFCFSCITKRCGEQGWRSGESTCLRPMWPGFESRASESASVVSLVCCWFSPLLQGIVFLVLLFPSPQKPTFLNSNSIWTQ